MEAMNYQSKFVTAVFSMLVMAIVSSRQFSLFVMFRDSPGLVAHGERFHLGFALAAGAAACVAGGVMLYLFLREDRNKWISVANTFAGPPPAASGTQLAL